MLRTITKLAVLASTCIVMCASLAGMACASNYTWTLSGGTGNWLTAGNWIPSGPPTSGYNAYVVNGGTAVIAQSGAACSTLYIGGTNTGWVQLNSGGLADAYVQIGTVNNGATGAGNLSLSSGTLNTTYAEYIGLSGKGTFTQSGGMHTVIGSGIGLAVNLFSEGTYNLDGGTLSCEQMSGGAGNSFLNLDGGKLVAAPGANSNFISGLSALTVGNSATASYTQSSGSDNVGVLYLGFNASAQGAYNLNGSGMLNATGEFIGTSGSGSFTQSGGTNTSSALVVGLEFGASGSFNLNGSGVLICNSYNPDYESIGSQGSGNFTQSGGTNSTNILYIGAGFGGNGTYNLNGGTLTCQQLQGGAGTSTLNLDGGVLLPATGASSNFISGLSTFTVGNTATASYAQSSGSLSVGNLNLGFNPSASGSYNLSNSAVLSISGNENVGYSGSGSFTQSGGTNSTNILHIGAGLGSNGTYNLNGGSLTCQQIQGGAGISTLNLDGGILLPAAGANSNFISGVSTLTIGNTATASYVQSSGSNNVGNLYLGFGPSASGSYNLSGSAVVSVSGDENIGYSGSGGFVQIGGTNNTYGLQLGFGTSTRGHYYLGGSGVLNASGGESIGSVGRGIFTQSAGINNAAFLQLGQMAGGSGTYNLKGGLLSSGQVLGGAGTSTFNFNGGVLQAAAGAASNFMSGLTAAYVEIGGATIDTNGQTVTINQAMLDGGGGGLSVIGGGALTLAKSNTYAGGTTLNGAWIVTSNGTQGSATGNGPVTVYSGGLAAGPAGGTITGPVILGTGGASVIAPAPSSTPARMS